MTQLHELSARELADAYRTGETDPVEAVEHFLDRIDARDAELGAFVTVTAESARIAARTMTERLHAHSGADALPPLAGVPTAIKDLNQTAGVRTTFGSRAFAEHVPAVSDEVVLRMERAGMISLGKTNTPEFGCPCYTEPDPAIAPPARSPCDTSRSAGGSSGGAAAAVAGGLLPIAQASDGGGSIRIPASVCGLVGFKPSRGRVSRAPTFGDITGLSTPGPMARTVRDAAALLDVLAGPAVGEPAWAPPLPVGETYLDHCERPPGRLRIARFANAPLAHQPVDPQVRGAYEQTSTLLERLGHEVVDIAPPIAADSFDAFETVWAVSAALQPVPPPGAELLRPLTRWLRSRAAAVSAARFGQALIRLRQVAAGALRATDGFDAILTPTLAQLPAAVGQLRNDADPAADFAAQVEYTPYCALWNVTGVPAVSLPAAWSDEGWPIGTMLAGRPAADAQLLALAAQVEEAIAAGQAAPHRP